MQTYVCALYYYYRVYNVSAACLAAISEADAWGLKAVHALQSSAIDAACQLYCAALEQCEC
eukprot:6879-Heterococcus_DN1.PRE.1